MGDANQPWTQRPPVGFPLSPLEVAIGLQEGLLCEVLGVVMVANAVIGVAVDVAQVCLVQLGELGIELRLRLRLGLVAHSLHTTPAGA